MVLALFVLGLFYTTCVECVSLAAMPSALPAAAPTAEFNSHWRQGTSLPTGTVSVIPGLDHQRMRHMGFRAETATARVRRFSDAGFSDAAVLEYELRYTELPRILRLRFEEAFPHRIVGWEEELRKGEGDDAVVLTTRIRDAIVCSSESA